MASLQKNVSGQNFTFSLVNATTGAALTGATVSVNVTKDNGAQASGGGTVTEKGNGQYNYAPTQAETNATDVGFLFTATSAIPVNYDFHPDVVDANGLLKVDTEDWKGTAVSSPATAGVPDVNAKAVNNVATTSVTAVNANLGTTQAITFDGNNLPEVDVEDINGNATAAQNVSKANQAIGRGTCAAGGSTTSVTTSAWSPGGSGVVSGQFIGRTIIFDANTTTAALQGQATNIAANTSGATPTFTVTALTTAPSSGDTFGVY
jgi:hypothetical protein